jgi:hypothetical protein
LANRFESPPEAWVQNQLFEQTSDYVTRGRRFEGLGIDQLNEEWAKAFCQFVTVHAGLHLRDMDDAGAELRLRGAEFPVHLVSSEAEQLRAAIRRIGAIVPPAKFVHDVRCRAESGH